MNDDCLRKLSLMDDLRQAHDSIINGWGELQNIGLANDRYYEAFRLLSIGLESLLKSCFCIIHKSESGSYPKSIKQKFGHDLHELKKFTIEKYTKTINNPEEVSFLCNDFFLDEIIQLLSKFAKNARYYNLDVVTTGINCTTPNVIEEWQELEVAIAKKLHICWMSLEIDPYPEINAFIIGKLERFIKDIVDILFTPPAWSECQTYIAAILGDFRRLGSDDWGTKNYRKKTVDDVKKGYSIITMNEKQLEEKGWRYKVVMASDFGNKPWPFVIDQVTVVNLGCSAFALLIDGILYMLNGLAGARYNLPDPHDMGVAKMGRDLSPFFKIAQEL